jgi:5-methylcytosine-specific restriction endonuclease McrA
MFFDVKKKSKYVPKTKRQLRYYQQKGKCAGCGKSFKSLGVKPILHHIGKTSRISDIQLLCPNCHDEKAHEWKTITEPLIGKQRVIVRKRLGKKKVKKKRESKKPKKRSLNLYDMNLG